MKTRLLALLVLLVPLALPAGASAVAVPIDGSPLNVFAGDTGRLQARFDDSTSGEFFSSVADEANAGLNVAFVAQPDFELWGYLGLIPVPVSQSPVTGDGSPGNPLTQVTSYRMSPSFRPNESFLVTQTITYANGNGHFDIRFTITHEPGDGNVGAIVRPYLSADLYVHGSDAGSGLFEAGPPRFVGGANFGVGSIGGIVELSPWARFEEDGFGEVNAHVVDPSGTALDNSVNPEVLDNGVAVQWPDRGLGGGTSVTYDARWQFRRFKPLALDPETGSRLLGETHRVKATSETQDGSPAAGRLLRYTIDGANPGSGTVTTGADGTAEIAWRGRVQGQDFLTVVGDFNNDGVRGADEPERTASVDWLGAPQLGSSFNARPLSGQVFFKPPPGSALARRIASRPRAPGAPAGFAPLTQADQLPMNTIIEATRGKLLVQSAKSTTGAVQTADFSAGQFQLRQQVTRRPITEMVMKGGNFRRTCGRSAKGAASIGAEAAGRRGRRVRRLRGSGRGRFRTRGQRSSATVRGTTWTVTDYCGGTLTSLPRRPRSSRVDVRDFVQRRTIRLRAGQSYFAAKRR